MKFATLCDGTPDGQLLVVSRDLRRAVPATGIASSLRVALETWNESEPRLRALSDAELADPAVAKRRVGKAEKLLIALRHGLF